MSNRRIHSPAKESGIQLKANEEHINNDSQLTDDSKIRRNIRRQNEVVGVHRNHPEKRWPKQNAAENLSDYGRLPNFGEQAAEQTSHSNNSGKCEKQMCKDR